MVDPEEDPGGEELLYPHDLPASLDTPDEADPENTLQPVVRVSALHDLAWIFEEAGQPICATEDWVQGLIINVSSFLVL